jgi:hypothetical protein
MSVGTSRTHFRQKTPGTENYHVYARCVFSRILIGALQFNCALVARHRKKGGVMLPKKKNGAGWLKRLPCSGFLEPAIKMPFWTILKFGHFGMKLGHFGAR